MAVPSPAAPSGIVDLKTLLDACNQASTQVAVLHIAFMAVCFYVLVIVFGTTDLDLLIGKGVKLPIVDVEVPIVGFYASAPLLVVLVHFNLMLQLQLLSRKLHAFEDLVVLTRTKGETAALLTPRNSVASEHSLSVDERDLLHIFPCTFYLIGQTRGFIRHSLSVVVAITLILMPLATLLMLQLRFLAYQSELITWIQRIGVWSDVTVIFAVWPAMMDRRGMWRNYICSIWRVIRLRWRYVLYPALLFSFLAIYLFAEHPPSVRMLVAIATLVALLIEGTPRIISLAGLNARMRNPPGSSRRSAALPVAKGMYAFIFGISIGLVIPVALVAKGETLEKLLIDYSYLDDLNRFRVLDLREEPLFSKPVTPEILVALKGDLTHRLSALPKLDRINLANRGLRGADFASAFLSGADFRSAHLEDADFSGAHIEGAQFMSAQLMGARLRESHSEGADFTKAKLDGADLAKAHLEASKFILAEMEGVVLSGASLQGASFYKSSLGGANLKDANLKAADFRESVMINADLRNTDLFAHWNDTSHVAFVDIRGAKWDRLSDDELHVIRQVKEAVPDREPVFSTGLEHALLSCAVPPVFTRCLSDRDTSPAIICEGQFDFSTYKELAYEYFETLACHSTPVAARLIASMPFFPTDDGILRADFFEHLQQITDQCGGMQGLTAQQRLFLERMLLAMR